MYNIAIHTHCFDSLNSLSRINDYVLDKIDFTR